MILTLEKALAYINDDELVEITPENIRLRETPPKTLMTENERKEAPQLKLSKFAGIFQNGLSNLKTD